MAEQDQLLKALRDEACRIQEDSLYSSRGHFQAAMIWGRIHLWIGLPIALLAAVGAGAALKQAPVLAAIIGAVVAALTAGATFLNPSGKSQTHHTAGVHFNSLRNQARIFHDLGLIGPEVPAELRQTLDQLAARRDDLNEASPQVPPWAFRKARRSIEAGEASYAIDSGKAALSGPSS